MTYIYLYQDNQEEYFDLAPSQYTTPLFDLKNSCILNTFLLHELVKVSNWLLTWMPVHRSGQYVREESAGQVWQQHARLTYTPIADYCHN